MFMDLLMPSWDPLRKCRGGALADGDGGGR
jgi:hypothetical protein